MYGVRKGFLLSAVGAPGAGSDIQGEVCGVCSCLFLSVLPSCACSLVSYECITVLDYFPLVGTSNVTVKYHVLAGAPVQARNVCTPAIIFVEKYGLACAVSEGFFGMKLCLFSPFFSADGQPFYSRGCGCAAPRDPGAPSLARSRCRCRSLIVGFCFLRRVFFFLWFLDLQTWINQMANGEDSGSGLWLYIIVSVASFFALLFRTLLITSGSLRASR